MFVDRSITRLNGKAYPRHLLRELGKVKHRTIANLSHCKAEEVEAIRLALRHKADLTRIVSAAGEGGLELVQGPSYLVTETMTLWRCRDRRGRAFRGLLLL